MDTLLIAAGSGVCFLVAYHTYGRWLSRAVFVLDRNATVPSHELRDDVDFIPTKKEVIFGHHFTSIAGTGPIVGPAIAVFWGWLPALAWVLLGSIFIGAVHDFGALVVSLRNRGQTVGEIAGRVISKRAKLLMLIILFLALTIVLAIFGLVIASIFKLYPESVLSVWVEIPIAVFIGYWTYRRGGSLMIPSLIALGLLYLAIYIGAYHLPLTMPASLGTNIASSVGMDPIWFNPVVLWTAILMIYCFCASVLPVWTLLQPRDFINSHQLVLALGLLLLGLLVAGLSGKAQLASSTPAIVDKEVLRTAGAPPILPFLFITIACGAVSGFHCLVSSGTSSKQVASEEDATYVGYGAMLLEGMLAVLVILACCAGVGMGKFDRTETADGGYEYIAKTDAAGVPIAGKVAWNERYDASKRWSGFNLSQKVGAFVEGGANFLAAIGIPLKMAIGIMAVLVASFAATTLDTATRLQRYVTQELGTTLGISPLKNKYVATSFALACGFAVAMTPGPSGTPGTGGLLLWPLFGATNQLLAGLAFLVIVFYLWRRNKPVWFAVPPLGLMVLLPAWAMLWNMFNGGSGWLWNKEYLLMGFGCAILGLQAWTMIEAISLWSKAKGVLEESLPPLSSSAMAGGRSC